MNFPCVRTSLECQAEPILEGEKKKIGWERYMDLEGWSVLTVWKDDKDLAPGVVLCALPSGNAPDPWPKRERELEDDREKRKRGGLEGGTRALQTGKRRGVFSAE